VGILQAILQAMLQGAGPVGYCLKVLKGIISAGCCARYLVGVLFLDPRSVPGITGSWALMAPGIAGSWALQVPGRCGFVGIADSWTLLAPEHCRSWKPWEL
jgi:hypothetical protein